MDGSLGQWGSENYLGHNAISMNLSLIKNEGVSLQGVLAHEIAHAVHYVPTVFVAGVFKDDDNKLYFPGDVIPAGASKLEVHDAYALFANNPETMKRLEEFITPAQIQEELEWRQTSLKISNSTGLDKYKQDTDAIKALIKTPCFPASTPILLANYRSGSVYLTDYCVC